MGKKIRIMHLLQSNRFSGAENVACQIISLLESDEKYEMIYCSPNGQISDALRERNIQFYPLKALTKKNLKEAITNIKPDIIHAHDRTASLLSAIVAKKRPIIVHMHVNNNKGLSLLFKNFIWMLYAKKYRHIFWVSNSSFNCFPFHVFLKKKSSVLYNVVNKNEIIEMSTLYKPFKDYDVVYVGRLTYQKNPIKLMEICHELNNKGLTVAVVGTGDYQDYVENYIANNCLNNIDYLGYVDNPLPIMAKAKVLILTSRF